MRIRTFTWRYRDEASRMRIVAARAATEDEAREKLLHEFPLIHHAVFVDSPTVSEEETAPE